MHGPKRQTRARIEVLLGALAFAASVPAGKILLRGLPPMAISGGLYLAAGLFCLGLLIADPERKATAENRLKGGEWWWLAAAVGCGGRARAARALLRTALEQWAHGRVAPQLRGGVYRRPGCSPLRRAGRNARTPRHRPGHRGRGRAVERRRIRWWRDTACERLADCRGLRVLGARQQFHSAHQPTGRSADRGHQRTRWGRRESRTRHSLRAARELEFRLSRERADRGCHILRAVDRALHPWPARAGSHAHRRSLCAGAGHGGGPLLARAA